MHIQFILHAEFEKPGTIETWAKKNKYTFSITSPYKGEVLPSHDDYDFLIIMGGPQSPTNLLEYPYLKDEILFTKHAIDNNKRILGVCLGAQIIGEALGAKVEQSPYKEIGTFPISLTQDGLHDPIFKRFPHEFDVVHWHNDMPGIPPGAKILAESAGCPRQLIRFGKKIYGLQCYMEMTSELIKGMIQHCGEDLQNGLFVQSPELILATDFTEINDKLNFVLDEISKL